MKTKQEKKQERKMTELKTLKDIESGRKEISNEWVFKKDLKAEAIKRCHYFKQLGIKSISSEDYSYWMGRFDEARIMNNLTKEDLKDE